MNTIFKNHLLKISNSSTCKEVELIQLLWSNYGKISRYQLDDSPNNTVIVKHINLTQPDNHPRGWNTEFSHNRKVKSYQVESHWYNNWNQQCTDLCRTPKFIGDIKKGKEQWIVLEDMDVNYPLRKQVISLEEIKVCLRWLANFHATFLNQVPKGLWDCGTYWHLQTRPNEFEKIKHSELKRKAHLIDECLSQCKHRTIVHGDAKLANFCFSRNGEAVAALDFQYVGGGCGMKDLAYFLGSCLLGEQLERLENKLLAHYFLALQEAFNHREKTATSFIPSFEEVAQEWRKLYPYACADFTRFLLGWMPNHQKVNSYNLHKLDEVLSAL